MKNTKEKGRDLVYIVQDMLRTTLVNMYTRVSLWWLLT